MYKRFLSLIMVVKMLGFHLFKHYVIDRTSILFGFGVAFICNDKLSNNVYAFFQGFS